MKGFFDPMEFIPKGTPDDVVYYVQEVDRGRDENRIVIGTTNLRKQGVEVRLGQYKSPSKLKAVAWEPGDYRVERSRRRQFALHRVQDLRSIEWFHPVSILLDHIERMKKEHGDVPKSRRNGRSKNSSGRGDQVSRMFYKLRGLPISLVEAVAWVVMDWYDSGREPAGDGVLISSNPKHHQMIADVIAKWMLLTGRKRKEFCYDSDFVVYDVLGKVRRVSKMESEMLDGEKPLKTKLRVLVREIGSFSSDDGLIRVP